MLNGFVNFMVLIKPYAIGLCVTLWVILALAFLFVTVKNRLKPRVYHKPSTDIASDEEIKKAIDSQERKFDKLNNNGINEHYQGTGL